MIHYLKKHEKDAREMLTAGGADLDWKELRRQHWVQINRMQHERLIHLLVTLFCGFFFLTILLAAMISGIAGLYAVSALFLLLAIPYLIHYFRLENGVQ